MSIEINIPPLLQSMADNIKQVAVNGDTVGACLDAMVKRYPQMKPKLFNGDGVLNKSINIFVNGKSIYPAGVKAAVLDGDEIHITYVVLGG
jgi:molybdopterin converting factor small subunit